MNNTSGEKVPSYIHINPNHDQIEVNSLFPIVVMKKIKLRSCKLDDEFECLPEVLEEEDTSLLEDPREEGPTKPQEHELSFIHTMNNEERNAHIQKCLEMSLENKITPKNAFALQLIDCLKLLVQEKKDFPTMACTLDAGAKIYSNRVDGLYQQVVKLADEVILNQKQNKTSDKESDQDESEIMTKEKRRARKKNIIVSSESLQRKLKGKDPRSRFIKLEGLPGSITNRVRRDPNDLSYSLENNLPFWKNWDQPTPLRTGGTVTMPNIKILWENQEMPDKIQLDTETIFEKTVDSLEENPEPFEEPLDDGDDVPATDLDYDHSVDELAMNNLDEDNKTVIKEVGVIATVMKRLSQDFEANGVTNSTSTRLQAMKILFKEASDYHYLDIKNAHFWAGPEFWKRSRVGVQEKKKNLRKKKDPGEISYEYDLAMAEEKWNSLFKKRTILTTKTVHSWKKNKLTLPIDLKVELNLFFELFHVSNYDSPDENLQGPNKQIDSSVQENADAINDIGQDDIYDTEFDAVQELSGSSTSPDPLNASFYEGFPGQNKDPEDLDALNSAFYDVGLIPQQTTEASGEHGLGKVLKVQLSPSDDASFDETTLVPAPKIVSFEPIKYSVRPIQVDMRHLKETMMNIIHEEIERDMQEKMATPCSSASAAPIMPETRFSCVLKKLKNRLEKRTAQNLSTAIAFLALLTVTNENNLQLEDTGDSDVIIKLEN